MTKSARKILLPSFVITELASPTDENAIRVKLPTGSHDEAYFIRPKQDDIGNGEHPDINSRGYGFNLFPIVLDAIGAPWAEANIYLLNRIENSLSQNMSTYASIADSLTAYRYYLDETGIDWINFPAKKLSRPTYRYRGYLKLKIAIGEIAGTTAQRRMSAIISFYTWLEKEGVLSPAHAPWKASDQYIDIIDSHGFKLTKVVTTTDLSIKVAKEYDPYEETINDGGKLHPLTKVEQGWLVDALLALGNTEMTLIHLFALLTGARIQTILTFRVQHILLKVDNPNLTEIRIPAGPGTSIDTKNNKRIVLHIPVWFYEMLRTYALSERALIRRSMAKGGDNQNQYLFLSIRGTPLYQAKAETQLFNVSNTLRHAKTGQGVRQFIKERVIPFVRIKFNSSNFHYQFHDTRASFGMNLTDAQLGQVSKGEINLHQAREFVKIRMCHESSATTDKYLKYRNNLKLVRAVSADYDNHLHELVKQIIGNNN